MTIDDAKRSLDRYANEGIPTGGFLRACLANDFMEAIGQADDTSRFILHDIAAHIHYDLPSDCHGSYSQIDAWLEKGRDR